MPEQITQLEQRLRRLEELLSLLIHSDRYVFHKLIQLLDGRNIQLGIANGTSLGTGSTQKLKINAQVGFYNTTPVAQPTSGADFTNNVAAGGTNDQVDNWTDLTTFSNSASAIRNNQHQLARKLKQVNDGLRDLGLFT